MIPELGHYALILALTLGILQASLPLIGAWKHNIPYMQLAQYTSIGQFIFVATSFFILAYCFLTNDFSVSYVAKNSNLHLPLIYRFCAIWGAHEGSLLLWVFILSIWTLAVSIFSRRLPLEMLARILAVMAMISVGFYLFLLVTSDPFQRMLPNIPINGSDLNPILQDPGLAIHPPMLYMGYVGFSVAFAFAISGLISGRFDAIWARWSRPWTLVAWCFLTFGIILGSWWAYRELGWGGWWFWDPVENASFLPWLVGTALIHSLIVAEKRNILKAWTVLLAVSAFSLSLIGTFLVRSGILISVHAFAVDPRRGLFILQFLATVIGGSLALYAWRAKELVKNTNFHFFSRESMLLANNILLFIAMITVLLGTLYPLFMSALHLGKISVGAPYFNIVFIPIMIPLILLMGIAPFFQWHYFSLKKIVFRIFIVFIISAIFSFVFPLIFGEDFRWEAILGLWLSFWILFNLISFMIIRKSNGQFKIKKPSQSQLAMILAHFGIGITIIGLVLTTTYSEQRNLSMKVGEKIKMGAYQFQLEAIDNIKGPNYSGVQATMLVTSHAKIVAKLYPQLRQFLVGNEIISKTSINIGLFRDLYVALGSPLSGNAWEFRIYYKPFVRWIWAGGLLMILGGILALTHRRYRIK